MQQSEHSKQQDTLYGAAIKWGLQLSGRAPALNAQSPGFSPRQHLQVGLGQHLQAETLENCCLPVQTILSYTGQWSGNSSVCSQHTQAHKGQEHNA